MATQEMNHGAVAVLEPFLFPVGDLDLLPGNPRRGSVEDVAASYARFGQRKPIVARVSQGEGEPPVVISGNHQLLAARSLGWTHIAVLFVDDDEQEALAFSLADNRTSDLGTYDLERLAEFLGRTEELLGTGYSQQDYEDLLHQLEAPDLEKLAAGTKEPEDSDFWPLVSMRIPPPLHERWKKIRVEFDSDAEALERLVDVFDASLGHAS